jgi:hypothetical protein
MRTGQDAETVFAYFKVQSYNLPQETKENIMKSLQTGDRKVQNTKQGVSNIQPYIPTVRDKFILNRKKIKILRENTLVS